jgi:hypothetical protein
MSLQTKWPMPLESVAEDSEVRSENNGNGIFITNDGAL